MMLFLVIIYLCVSSKAWATTPSQIAKLNYLLDESRFDKLIRPGGGSPLTVSISMYILGIHNVDYIKQEYVIRVYYRTFWNDTRLMYTDEKLPVLRVPVKYVESMWHPDSYFLYTTQISQSKFIYSNIMGTIRPNGEVLTSRLLTLKQKCLMDFNLYPFDKQTCQTRLGSYAYTSDDLVFKWKDNSSLAISTQASLGRGFKMSGYSQIDNFSIKKTTGSYSVIGLNIELVRGFSYHMKSIFMPSIGLVSVSWLVFWFSTSATGNRLLFLLTCFTLHVLLVFRSVQLRPPVSHVTPLDYWNGICLFFMFTELLIVIKTGNDVNPEKKLFDKRQSIGSSPLVESEDSPGIPSEPKLSCPSFCPGFLQLSLTLTDQVARITFPVCFYTAVIFYFAYYQRDS